jgi:hypothetical protein
VAAKSISQQFLEAWQWKPFVKRIVDLAL